MDENIQNGTICFESASYINEEYLCLFPNFSDTCLILIANQLEV